VQYAIIDFVPLVKLLLVLAYYHAIQVVVPVILLGPVHLVLMENICLQKVVYLVQTLVQNVLDQLQLVQNVLTLQIEELFQTVPVMLVILIMELLAKLVTTLNVEPVLI